MMARAFAVWLVVTTPAIAQPTGDTTKFQPAILNAMACIRANAPPAYVASIRSVVDAAAYFQARCLKQFSASLAENGAAEAAPGSFRLIVREEWAAFCAHVGGC